MIYSIQHSYHIYEHNESMMVPSSPSHFLLLLPSRLALIHLFYFSFTLCKLLHLLLLLFYHLVHFTLSLHLYVPACTAQLHPAGTPHSAELMVSLSACTIQCFPSLSHTHRPSVTAAQSIALYHLTINCILKYILNDHNYHGNRTCTQ